VSPIWSLLVSSDASDNWIGFAFCPTAVPIRQHDLHICYLSVIFEPFVWCGHIRATAPVHFECLPITTPILAESLECVVPLQDCGFCPAGDSVDFSEEFAEFFLANTAAGIYYHVDCGCCVVAYSFHAEVIVAAVAPRECWATIADVLAEISAQ